MVLNRPSWTLSLNNTADEYSLKAEKDRSLTFVTKSNCLREKAEAKVNLVSELENKLKEKMYDLKFH